MDADPYLIQYYSLRQHVPGVDEPAQVANFEVQVRAGRIAGAAGATDYRTLTDTGATTHIGAAQVGVQ